MIFAAGSIVIDVIQAFVFRREYSEGTAKNMLTLPIGRSNFVAAKIVVSFVWYACIAAVVYGEALLLGLLVGLPGFDPALLESNVRLCLLVVLQTLLLGSLPAWIAVAGRGLPGAHRINDLLVHRDRPDLPSYRLDAVGPVVNHVPDHRRGGTRRSGSGCRFPAGSCRSLYRRMHRHIPYPGALGQYPIMTNSGCLHSLAELLQRRS